jgi:hypothetical protein
VAGRTRRGSARRLVLLATRTTLFVQVQEFLCRIPFLCKAGTVRKRTWTNRQGDTKVAWFADYYDQHGKRHRKTFATKEAAKVGLATAKATGSRVEPNPCRAK